ncbi:MAG: hypothetical protein ABW044_05355 [Cellvibrio sp.]
MREDKGHYCLDWDLMFITNKDPGFDSCTCFPVRSNEEIAAEKNTIDEIKFEYGIKK